MSLIASFILVKLIEARVLAVEEGVGKSVNSMKGQGAMSLVGRTVLMVIKLVGGRGQGEGVKMCLLVSFDRFVVSTIRDRLIETGR